MLSSLLFCRNDVDPPGHRVNAHQHTFWQLEVLRRGVIDFRCGKNVRLKTDDWHLVAPGAVHALHYRKRTHSLTLKFHCEEAALERLAGRWQPDSVLQQLAGCLEQCIPRGQRVSRSSEAVLVHLLAAALQRGLERVAATDVVPPSGRLSLAERAQAWVEAKDGDVASVREVAEHLSCSADYLSRAYRDEYGDSLKQHISRARLARACDLLAYSDNRIGEIAEQLHFADAFSFSRFFKQQAGCSPRQYRDRQT